ncbi:hypothetical protein RHMOL_Rhmol03G0088400 [Rhododendron molle]|uniref:Uncharacterized protein n=1 Tax=Rhododendron molle TaxID=49168 RepID=A0ACC0PC39_RHOML|nr:hypothetical protein RHMOL_Rhmol03G0088400 [Rhododendron molle]
MGFAGHWTVQVLWVDIWLVRWFVGCFLQVTWPWTMIVLAWVLWDVFCRLLRLFFDCVVGWFLTGFWPVFLWLKGYFSADFSMTSQDEEYYWVVFIGRNPGIYTSWETAELQVNRYPGNLKKRYKTFDEAEGALLQFHEERYWLMKMQSVRTAHQSSDEASTSASGLEVQHHTSIITYFVLVFLLGFVCCILLAHLFDSE